MIKFLKRIFRGILSVLKDLRGPIIECVVGASIAFGIVLVLGFIFWLLVNFPLWILGFILMIAFLFLCRTIWIRGGEG